MAAAGLFAVAIAQGSYDLVDRQSTAIVVWWAVGLGAVIAAPPRRPALPGIAATLCSAGIALWIAIGLSDTVSQERGVIELGRAVAHLGPLVLIGWVLPRGLWRSVLVGLLIGAVAVLVAALGQRLSPGFLGQTTAIVFQNTTQRLGSPLGYWNAVGSWAAITTLLLLAVSSHAPRPYMRALALSAVPLAATVGYLTYSRSAIGALALGLAVLLALSSHRWTAALHTAGGVAAAAIAIITVRSAPEIADATGTAGAGGVVVAVVLAGLAVATLPLLTSRRSIDERRMPVRTARITAAVTVVLVIAGAALAVDRYGDRAWDQFNTPTEVVGADPTARLTSLNGTRLSQWRAALDEWKDDRLQGRGAGTFEFSWNERATNAEFVRDAHNSFLEALAEQGIVGLLLLVGLVGSMIATALVAARRAASALERGLVAGAAAGLAAFTLGTAVDWFWELSALALLAMALLGALIAASAPERPPATGLRAAGARGAVLLLAVLAVLIELPGLVGTSEIRRSQQELARGDIEAARSHADQAIDIMYWASSPFLQRALVDERAGEWDAARTSLKLAIDRDPREWRLPLVLARVEAKAGRPDEALEAFRQAKALRPTGQFFQ